MSGEWDYLLRIVVADVSDYNHFLMQTLLGHPSVAGASSHFALSMTNFSAMTCSPFSSADHSPP